MQARQWDALRRRLTSIPRATAHLDPEGTAHLDPEGESDALADRVGSGARASLEPGAATPHRTATSIQGRRRFTLSRFALAFCTAHRLHWAARGHA